MSLTFKIAAGIVIGLLAAYILIGQFAEKQYESKSTDLYATQELHTAAMLFMMSAERFLDENGAMPQALSDVDCYAMQNCVTGQQGGVFYISRMNEWMALEPYIDVNELRFECRTTVKSIHIPFNRRIRDCGELDPESVPDFRALPE